MNNGIKVLFYIPSILKYDSRVKMLLQVSELIDNLVLLVGKIDPSVDTRGFRNLIIIDLKYQEGKRFKNIINTYNISKKIIKEYDVRIVHDTFGAFFPLFWLHRQKKIKYITSFYSINGWRIKEAWGGSSIIKKLSNKSTAMMYYGLLMEVLVGMKADRVILQAPGLIPHLQRYLHISRDRISVIPNNVDTVFWCRRDYSYRGVEKNELKLLYIGGVGGTRGMRSLLNLLKKAKEKCFPVVLTVAGRWEPFSQEETQNLIKKLDIDEMIHFLGPVNKNTVYHLFVENDVFIYQTINDGSPRVVLEAMAVGIPIIASRHPGIKVLDPSEKYLSFNDYNDVEKMYGYLNDYVDNKKKWNERAIKGAVSVRKNFSSGVISKKYASFYASILSS